MADALASGASVLRDVGVQVPLRPQCDESGHGYAWLAPSFTDSPVRWDGNIWAPRPSGRPVSSTGPTARRTNNELRRKLIVRWRNLNTLGRMSFSRPGRFAPLLFVPVVVLLASCGLFHTNSASAGMGQEVIDGKFAFIVTDISASPTFDSTSARGVWWIMSMAVRNVGTEPRHFEMAAQSLTDSEGRVHSATLMEPRLVNKIDPRLQVSVRLAFDVPPGVRPKQIMLRESASSPGAPVNLGQLSSSTPGG
jgi:Domain of unknown function (DUF4352)